MKMEKTWNQNIHNVKKFKDYHSLKMVTQFFLSVSLFSFFFSHSSFLHSINFCFSTFPYQLFTHTLDKNFIFLICNGLLVFLTKYSGLLKSLSLSNSKNTIEGYQTEFLMQQKKEKIVVNEGNIDLEENVAMEGGNDQEEYYFTNQREVEKEIVHEDKEQEKGSERLASNEEEEQQQDQEEEEEKYALVQEDEEEKKLSKDHYCLVEQGLEEEEEGNKEVEEGNDYDCDEEEIGNGRLSTEELNKKFDEFIRRMKEELRIEAQRQLIVV